MLPFRIFSLSMVLKKSSWGVPKRDSSNVKLTGLSFWLLTPFTSSCILRQGKISWDKGYPNPEERIKMSVFLCPKSLQSKTFLVPLLGCYKRKNHHGLHWCYKFWCHFFQVANVWCAFNVAIKIKDLYDVQTLAMGCLASTALASLPTNILLFMQPSKANLILALINTSLAFFLFSFQVHEKSILLVGIPVALLLGGFKEVHHRFTPLISVWLLTVTTASMFPLLQKDELAIPALALSVMFIVMCHFFDFFEPVRQVLQGSSQKGSRPSPKPLDKNEVN